MGAVGGNVASKVTKTLNIASGSSGSSTSSNSSNDAHRKGEGKNINIIEEDKNIEIQYVYSVEIPATNSGVGNFFLNIGGKIFTGSKFVHQGLIFLTCVGDYYVCQTYPIQLIKCNDYNDALDKIKKYWKINKDVKNENLEKTVYAPDEKFCLSCVKEELEKLPDEYDLFNYNCQHFCSKILKKFRLKKLKYDIILFARWRFICPKHKKELENERGLIFRGMGVLN